MVNSKRYVKLCHIKNYSEQISIFSCNIYIVFNETVEKIIKNCILFLIQLPRNYKS